MQKEMQPILRSSSLASLPRLSGDCRCASVIPGNLCFRPGRADRNTTSTSGLLLASPGCTCSQNYFVMAVVNHEGVRAPSSNTKSRSQTFFLHFSSINIIISFHPTSQPHINSQTTSNPSTLHRTAQQPSTCPTLCASEHHLFPLLQRTLTTSRDFHTKAGEKMTPDSTKSTLGTQIHIHPLY